MKVTLPYYTIRKGVQNPTGVCGPERERGFAPPARWVFCGKAIAGDGQQRTKMV